MQNAIYKSIAKFSSLIPWKIIWAKQSKMLYVNLKTNAMSKSYQKHIRKIRLYIIYEISIDKWKSYLKIWGKLVYISSMKLLLGGGGVLIKVKKTCPQPEVSCRG